MVTPFGPVARMLVKPWPAQPGPCPGETGPSSRATVALDRCRVKWAQPPMVLVMVTQRGRLASPRNTTSWGRTSEWASAVRQA